MYAVLVERRGVAVEHAFAALALVFERPDVRRQQAVQSECVALRLSECRAFVEARIHEQIVAREGVCESRVGHAGRG